MWSIDYPYQNLSDVNDNEVLCSCSDNAEVSTFSKTIFRLTVQEAIGGDLNVYMQRVPQSMVSSGGPSASLEVYDIDASFASVCSRALPLMGCPSSAVQSVNADSFTCSCGNFTLLGAAVSTLVMQQAMTNK